MAGKALITPSPAPSSPDPPFGQEDGDVSGYFLWEGQEEQVCGRSTLWIKLSEDLGFIFLSFCSSIFGVKYNSYTVQQLLKTTTTQPHV